MASWFQVVALVDFISKLIITKLSIEQSLAFQIVIWTFLLSPSPLSIVEHLKFKDDNCTLLELYRMVPFLYL